MQHYVNGGVQKCLDKWLSLHVRQSENATEQPLCCTPKTPTSAAEKLETQYPSCYFARISTIVDTHGVDADSARRCQHETYQLCSDSGLGLLYANCSGPGICASRFCGGV